FLAALERGLLPDSVREDKPIALKGWKPENYSREYYGPVTLTQALAHSLNTVSVRLTQEVGPVAVAKTAYRLGIASKLEANPSLALGTSEVSLIELVAAYAPFANGGDASTPHVIERVRTSAGKALYVRSSQSLGRIVEARHVAMMNAMMRETLASGTAQKAQVLGLPAAGKTGTSQDFRDAWFVGYTADYVGGVWFGNDDGKPMHAISGGTLPAVLWGRIMARAHEGLPVRPLGTDAPLMAGIEEPAATEAPESGGGFLERLITRLLSGGEGEEEGAAMREPQVRRPAKPPRDR
ncbi:MAG: transglycosylase domain-containing protein, partial [Kiloniellales bacterium]